MNITSHATRLTRRRWYKALREFDGQSQVDVGQQILEALNIGPNTPKGSSGRKGSTADKLVRKLRRTSSAFTFPGEVTKNVLVAEPEPPHPKTKQMLFGSINLLLILARAGNNELFWGAVILTNLCVYQAFKLKPKKKRIEEKDESTPALEEVSSSEGGG